MKRLIELANKTKIHFKLFYKNNNFSIIMNSYSYGELKEVISLTFDDVVEKAIEYLENKKGKNNE